MVRGITNEILGAKGLKMVLKEYKICTMIITAYYMSCLQRFYQKFSLLNQYTFA